jgi:ABC-type spermidine/putrescine transport system permease subunit II
LQLQAPLANTLLFATLAAGAAAFIGVPVGWILVRTRSTWTSVLDVTATLPFAVAGTILAIGLVIAFNAGGLVLTGGWLIMVLAYTVRKLPFTVRASSAILHPIPRSRRRPSASAFRRCARWRLVVPLMLGGIVSGMVLTWVTVASELSSTVVLYSGPWRTLTIVMFQALEGTGAGIAVAAASLLIAITLIHPGCLPIAATLRAVHALDLLASGADALSVRSVFEAARDCVTAAWKQNDSRRDEGSGCLDASPQDFQNGTKRDYPSQLTLDRSPARGARSPRNVGS